MAYNPDASLSDTLADDALTVRNRISDGAVKVKETISEVGRKAAGTINENIAGAATSFDKAAATLHETAENLPGVDKLSGLAHTAADKLSATAGYLRENSCESMTLSLKTLIKKNPGPSLLAAGVIGFLVGRTFSRPNRD